MTLLYVIYVRESEVHTWLKGFQKFIFIEFKGLVDKSQVEGFRIQTHSSTRVHQIISPHKNTSSG